MYRESNVSVHGWKSMNTLQKWHSVIKLTDKIDFLFYQLFEWIIFLIRSLKIEIQYCMSNWWKLKVAIKLKHNWWYDVLVAFFNLNFWRKFVSRPRCIIWSAEVSTRPSYTRKLQLWSYTRWLLPRLQTFHSQHLLHGKYLNMMNSVSELHLIPGFEQDFLKEFNRLLVCTVLIIWAERVIFHLHENLTHTNVVLGYVKK